MYRQNHSGLDPFNFLSAIAVAITSNKSIIYFYLRVPPEADWTGPVQPPQTWPQQGRVRFHSYSTKYRPGLDLVLRDLSCSFQPQEKVLRK